MNITDIFTMIPIEGGGVGRFVAIGIAVIAMFFVLTGLISKIGSNYIYKAKALISALLLEVALYVYVKSLLSTMGLSVVVEDTSIKYIFFFYFDRVLKLTPGLSHEDALSVGMPVFIAAIILFLGYGYFIAPLLKRDRRLYVPGVALLLTFATFAGGVGLYRFMNLFIIRGFELGFIVVFSVYIFTLGVWFFSGEGINKRAVLNRR